MNNTEYLETLMNVTLLPDNIQATYNIDEQCNFDNLFRDDSDKFKFYKAVKDICHLKNKCEFDPENIPYNITTLDDKGEVISW